MAISKRNKKLKKNVFKRSLLSLSIGGLLSAGQAIAAAPQPEANSGINVTEKNGVPIVEIVAPTGVTGLSHNKFVKYDVDTGGLVINNSMDSAQSELVGEISRNSNFSAREASVIVSEVTGSDISTLAGAQEIVGSEADFVLANPNGINVNGASFINTSNATLTVGSPLISQTDEYEGVTTKSAVSGANLNVSGEINADGGLALLAPVISTSADTNISAGDEVAVLLGKFDFTPGGAKLIDVAEASNDEVVVDAVLMGAMTAGRINIISTTSGAGVNLGADLTANGEGLAANDGGGIKVKSAGDLDLSGEHKVTSTALANVQSDTETVKFHSALYETGGHLDVSGLTVAANDGVDILGVKSVSLKNTTVEVADQGFLAVNSSGDISLNGVTSEGGSGVLVESAVDQTNTENAVVGNVNVVNSSFTANRQVKVSGPGKVSVMNTTAITRVAEQADDEDGNIFALIEGDAVTVNNLTTNTDVTQIKSTNGDANVSNVDASEQLYVMSTDGNIRISGNIESDKKLEARSQKGTVNLSGNIDAGSGDLVSNSAQTTNVSGTVSGENVTITSTSGLTANGNLTADNRMALVSDKGLNVHNRVSGRTVRLAGKEGVNVTAGTLVKGQDIVKVASAEGALNVQGAKNNFANIISDDKVIVDTQSMRVAAGKVESGGEMRLDVKKNVGIYSTADHRSGGHSSSSSRSLGQDCITILFILNFCGEKKQHTNTQVSWSETFNISSLVHAGTNLWIREADRIDIVGSRVTAGNDATFITDEGDIDIKHAVNSRHEVTKRHIRTNSWIRNEERWDDRVENSTSTHSSVVKAESNLTMTSAGDINITGSSILAEGALKLEAAEDIAIKAAKNTYSVDAKSHGRGVHLTSAGIFGLGIGINWTSQKSSVDIDGSTHTGSQVVGGSVEITNDNGNKEHDITVEGSVVSATAGDLDIDADRDFNSLATYDTKTANVSKETTHNRFEIGLLHIGLSSANAKGKLNAEKTTANTNLFSSAGNINVTAGNHILDQAGTYEAAGDIKLEADSVTQEAVKESVSYDANLDQHSASFSLGLDVNGLKAQLSSWEKFIGSVVELAKGPTQSKRPINNFDRITNATGGTVERETVTTNLGFDDLDIPGNLLKKPNLNFSKPTVKIGIAFSANSSHMDFSKDHDKERGGLISGNSVTITALNGDVNLEGSEIVGVDDNVEITGQNVNFTELEENYRVEANHTTTSAGFDLGITLGATPGVSFEFKASGSNYDGNSNRHTETAGSVDAAQDALLVAENGKITLVGTNITAGDDIGLNATDGIDVQATNNSYSSSQNYDAAKFGFNIGVGPTAPFINELGVNASVKHEDLSVSATYHGESSFKAGGNVDIKTTNGNVDLAAPDIEAGEDVTIASQNGSVNINDSIDKAHLNANSNGAGFEFSWEAPLTFGAGFNVTDNTHTINAETSDTTQIAAGGNVTVAGGTGVTMVGTDIGADGNVTLDGGTGSVDIQASVTDSNENLSVNDFDFGFNTLKLGQKGGDEGIQLPGIDLDVDVQRLNVVTHTEKPGSISAGGDLTIDAEGALNLHGTVITAAGETNITTAGINAQAAVSTQQGGGNGFQLGLGVPSYTVGKKEESKVLPNLPNFSTGFQHYEVDKQTVINASINGQAINPSSLGNKDHEHGVDFGFGVNFTNANNVKANAGELEGDNDTLTNIAFGAAAVATLLTDNDNNRFKAGEFRPGFGFQQPNMDLNAGSSVEGEISDFFSNVPDFDFDEFTNL
ncbi:hemagglutinin repeat-containing protein [Veronia pacifica]|nr:hemagglutinin repeat-containing protein [Veronia pacifica]